MTGAPNAKRILNEAARAAVQGLKCDLSNLQDCTRGLDGDLVEAIAADNPNRDNVAHDGQKVDEQFMAVVAGFKATVADYHGKYNDLRKALELG